MTKEEIDDLVYLLGKDWKHLGEAIQKNDLKLFFKLYSEYLKDGNLYSPRKILLHYACQKVAEKLDDTGNNL